MNSHPIYRYSDLEAYSQAMAARKAYHRNELIVAWTLSLLSLGLIIFAICTIGHWVPGGL